MRLKESGIYGKYLDVATYYGNWANYLVKRF